MILLGFKSEQESCVGLCAKQSRHAHVIAGAHVCLYNSRLGLILYYMSSSDVVIERLNKYSRADAVGMGDKLWRASSTSAGKRVLISDSHQTQRA